MNHISANVGLEWFVKCDKIVHLIRHITLDIHWPTSRYSSVIDRRPRRTESNLLKQTMATVGTMVSHLPALRTVDVSWSQIRLSRSDPEESSPSVCKTLIWLRGLQQARRRNESVLIRMPPTSLMSTEELARCQEDLGPVRNLVREFKEDLRELMEFADER